MVATNDFSGLTNSIWALASAPANAPPDLQTEGDGSGAEQASTDGTGPLNDAREHVQPANLPPKASDVWSKHQTCAETG
jgi:hypothetical protein